MIETNLKKREGEKEDWIIGLVISEIRMLVCKGFDYVKLTEYLLLHDDGRNFDNLGLTVEEGFGIHGSKF